jgi:hypothetical protein
MCIHQEVQLRQKCPLDRKILLTADLNLNSQISKEIDALKIHCFYGCKWEKGQWVVQEGGCSALIPLGNRKEHEENCTFKGDSDSDSEDN